MQAGPGQSEFEPYLRAWDERRRRERAERERAVARAMAEAQQIADVLVASFGAQEVWLFGSLARAATDPRAFHERSDIDLAVRGLDPRRYFTAVAAAMGLTERSVQIVELERCRPELAATVQREGVRLRGATGADPTGSR